MELGWQDAAVAMLAGMAVAWLLARRAARRGRPGCQDCPGCAPPARRPGPADAGAPPARGPVVIPLSDLKRRD